MDLFRSFVVTMSLVVISCVYSTTALATDIALVEIIDVNSNQLSRPGGVAYHRQRQTLFATIGIEITEIALDGSVLNAFTLPQFHSGSGIDILPNGNISNVDDVATHFEYTPDGVYVSERTIDSGGEPIGVGHHPILDTYFYVDDDDAFIYELDANGTRLSQFNYFDLGMQHPEGIDVDPLADSLIVAELNHLYILSLTGEIRDIIDVDAITGLNRAYGVDYDDASRRLYLAYGPDSGGQKIAVLDMNLVPEPGSFAFLVGLSACLTMRRVRSMV